MQIVQLHTSIMAGLVSGYRASAHSVALTVGSRSRRGVAMLAAMAVLIGWSAIPQYGVGATTGTRCVDASLPVSLAPSQPRVYHVFGVLCGLENDSSVVQLLVPGLTYSHIYWDFPLDPDTYSYVRHATAAGYATFDVDRIGIGRSSRPPAVDVTFASNAYVLHQIVTALRTGAIDGHTFASVAWVGHSGGSLIGDAEVARYHDVDAVVLTGFLHAQGSGLPAILAKVVPAQDEKVTASYHAPLGYFTTAGNARTTFYDTANAQPDVIAADTATQETATVGELGGIVPGELSQESRRINVPVLLVDGSADHIMCGIEVICSSAQAILKYSRWWYAAAPVLDAYVATGSGHDLQLQTSAPATDAAMLAWLEEYAPAR